jgi:hypothetical protein
MGQPFLLLQRLPSRTLPAVLGTVHLSQHLAHPGQAQRHILVDFAAPALSVCLFHRRLQLVLFVALRHSEARATLAIVVERIVARPHEIRVPAIGHHLLRQVDIESRVIFSYAMVLGIENHARL